MRLLIGFLWVLGFAGSPVPAQAQTGALQIVSPAPGTLVEPGQTVSVIVSVDNTVAFRAVRVIAQDIAISDFKSGPPFEFMLTVPMGVVGAKRITALGVTAPETGVFSEPVTIVIEKNVPLSALEINLTEIEFEELGQQFPLSVMGVFTDGSRAVVTRSTLTTYHSGDPQVATVDARGLVTAVGPGTTLITVIYGNQASNVSVIVRQITAALDTIAPTTTAFSSPGPNTNGWNNTDVAVTLSAVDNAGGSGVKEINFSLDGAQTGTGVVAGGSAAVTVTAEGATTLTYAARDNAGNEEVSKTLTVRIDKTPPVISGLPASGCTLWPPNHKLVPVATVTATDALSGVVPGSLIVMGSSSEPESGLGDGNTAPDVLVSGGAVQLRAERSGAGTGRIYTLAASAADHAGNMATALASCVVPHDQR